MPFKSEAQRRYLWANEPEIARDWTDTYGSRIQRDEGGIMRVPFYAGEEVESLAKETPLSGQLADRTQKDINTITGMRGYEIQDPQMLYDMLKDQLSPGFTVDDMIQIQKTGKKTEPTASLNEFADIEGHTAMGENIMRDFTYDDAISEDPARVSGLEYLDQFKSNIPSDWPTQRKKGFGALPYDELDDYEAQDIDRERIEELRRLASMEQYPEEDEEQISPFKQWSRNFWANPGRRVMQGINMALPIGPLWKGITGAALQGGQGLREGLTGLRGRHPTQNAYEQARQHRILQGRIDYMKQRREDDLKYSPTNLANLLQQTGQKDDWVPPAPKVPPPYIHQPTGPQQQNGGGGIPDVARDLGMTGSYDHGWT